MSLNQWLTAVCPVWHQANITADWIITNFPNISKTYMVKVINCVFRLGHELGSFWNSLPNIACPQDHKECVGNLGLPGFCLTDFLKLMKLQKDYYKFESKLFHSLYIIYLLTGNIQRLASSEYVYRLTVKVFKNI